MRIVFCGSGPFAVASLRAIAGSNHELVKVITQPARRAGRGGKRRATHVSSAGRELELEVVEVADINSPHTTAMLRSLDADVMCVADFGQMIRADAREGVRLDTFNLHASLLPELRGAAPINWAIIGGHRRTGVTTFSLVDKMDAGGIHLQEQTDIREKETALELRDRLATIGADLVLRTLDLIASGNVRLREQDESRVTLAPRLKKTDGIIDWSQDCVTVRNRIHGTWDWPGAQTIFHGNRSRETRVVIARAVAEQGATAGEPGAVDEDLCVASGSGRIRILDVKPANKRLMSWSDFVNGYRVAQGDRFVGIDPCPR